MPIKIPDGLPAIDALRRENIFCITRSAAEHQDIRPLRILLLNLMKNHKLKMAGFRADFLLLIKRFLNI